MSPVHKRGPAHGSSSSSRRPVSNDMTLEEKRKSLMDHPEQRHLARLSSQMTRNATASPSSTLRSSIGVGAVRDDANSFAVLDAGRHPSEPWTVESLVKSSSNFDQVPRISASSPELLAQVQGYEESGVPFIIERWHERPDWDPELFDIKGFVGDGDQVVEVRNVRTSEDVKMPLRKLVEHYQTVSKHGKCDAIYYGKDMHCPKKWEAALRSGLPEHFHPFGADDMFSHLSPRDRPETLMCYLGINGTFTPAHKDLCGSYGHNLMCHTADGGSAVWLMTASGRLQKDEPTAYFHNMLNAELDFENHKATVEEFSRAPFHVYVAEQRLGDLVLVPPRSCHQVINRGGVTIKMSWSRMGLKSLEYSLYSELALYHRVCRLETYRVKLTVFAAVKQYAQRLSTINPSASSSSPISTASNLLDLTLPVSSCRDRSPPSQPTDLVSPLSQLLPKTIKTLTSLLFLFDEILVEEWTPNHHELKQVPGSEPDAPHALHICDFCGADIFQSFFACPQCATSEDGSEFICCPNCYVEGRSCTCGAARMEPRQSWRFEDLINERNKAAEVLNVHLPSGEKIYKCTTNSLGSSHHLRTFLAACKLWENIRKTSSVRKLPSRCRSESYNAHDVDQTHILQCSSCASGMCFRHILELNGMHAAEAILIATYDGGQTEWHTLHTDKKEKRRALSLSEHRDRERGGPQPLSKRMAWAAETFRTCRPIDVTRAREGFYDLTKLVDLVDSGIPVDPGLSNALDDAQQAPKGLPSVPSKTTAMTLMLRDDSPLTELSDSNSVASMDIDDTSSDDTDHSSDADFSSGGLRIQAVAKIPGPATPLRSITRKPKTPSKKPRQTMLHVLVPFIGKKRIATDYATSVTPPKKARIDVPSLTLDSRRRPIPATVPRCTVTSSALITSPLSTKEIPRFRSTTLVPIGSRNPTTVRERQGQPIPVPSRPLPNPPRVGCPPRSAKPKATVPRFVSMSRESSVDRSQETVPTPPTQTKQTSAEPIRQDPVGIMAALKPFLEAAEKEKEELRKEKETLRKENKEMRTEMEELRNRYEESRREETKLRLQMVGLMNEASGHRNSELLVENSRLKDELAGSRKKEEESKRREQEVEQQLANQSRQWSKVLDDRDHNIEYLTYQLQQSQAVAADKERSMGGMTHVVGMLGHSIGTAMAQQNMHLQRRPSQLPFGGMAAPGAGGSFQQGFGRGKGQQAWHGRNRGTGQRIAFGGVSHRQFFQNSSQPHVSQERRPEFTSHQRFYDDPGLPSSRQADFPEPFDHSRGRSPHIERLSRNKSRTPPRESRTPPRESRTPPRESRTLPRGGGTPSRESRTPPREGKTPSRGRKLIYDRDADRERYDDASALSSRSACRGHRDGPAPSRGRDDTTSTRSLSPVSQQLNDGSDDRGWPSYHRGASPSYADDGSMRSLSRPATPNLTAQSRSLSPPGRYIEDDQEDREHVVKHGDSHRGSFSKERRKRKLQVDEPDMEEEYEDRDHGRHSKELRSYQ